MRAFLRSRERKAVRVPPPTPPLLNARGGERRGWVDRLLLDPAHQLNPE